jgi:tellurite resistance protein
MDVDIGRDTLVALAAIAWADGSIDPSEAKAIRSAAQQLGLSQQDLGYVEETLRRPVPLEEVETVRMSRLTRLFTFAVANWIAQADGQIPREEQVALDLLAERLGLSTVARERAKSVGLSMAQAGGDGGQGLDVLQLRSRLSAGLSQIGND